MIVSEKSIRLTVRNVALSGDTDVLPYPIENHWFYDAEDQVCELLKNLDGNYDDWEASYPLLWERVLSGVGYVGFRAATQIDPIWNAYFLALLIEVGGDGCPVRNVARRLAARAVLFSLAPKPIYFQVQPEPNPSHRNRSRTICSSTNTHGKRWGTTPLVGHRK